MKAHDATQFSRRVIGVVLFKDIFATNFLVAERWFETLWQQLSLFNAFCAKI